jgi:hypothetical protein
MIYIYEVSLVSGLTNVPLRTIVECVSADNPNNAKDKLNELVPPGWVLRKATLIGSRNK